MKELIRTVIFRPYRKGMGPVFTLRMYDTGGTIGGKNRVAYTLRSKGKTIFEGDDFGCSPMDSIDSDSAVAALMGFLTLRPGDTDREYFENHSEEQMEYCSSHAEALSCHVLDRFGDC